MFEGLQEDQLKGAVEAMLFVTDEPVGTIALAEMLECDVAQVEAALEFIRDERERSGSGIQLREVAGGWRLFTHPAYHELIEKYVLSWDTRKLSGAAMETLAIVAYTQPTTRAALASVRGVNSDSPLNSLIEKGLVREVGTADTPGNPVLYGTTRGFLEKFGLRSPADLPDLADFAPDEETRRLITERLSATRADVGVSDECARSMARELLGEGEDGYAEDRASLLFGDDAADREDDLAERVDELAEQARVLAEEARAASEGAAADEGADASASAGANAEMREEAEEAAAPTEPAAVQESSDASASTGSTATQAAAQTAAQKSAEAMFAEAIASTLGVVDKIDFDSLTFETDDE